MKLERLLRRTKIVITALTTLPALIVNLLIVTILYGIATNSVAPWNYVGITLIGLISFLACLMAIGMTLKVKITNRWVRYIIGALIGLIWVVVTTAVMLKPKIDLYSFKYTVDFQIPFPIYLLIVLALVVTAIGINIRIVVWFANKVRTAK